MFILNPSVMPQVLFSYNFYRHNMSTQALTPLGELHNLRIAPHIDLKNKHSNNGTIWTRTLK